MSGSMAKPHNKSEKRHPTYRRTILIGEYIRYLPYLFISIIVTHKHFQLLINDMKWRFDYTLKTLLNSYTFLNVTIYISMSLY